MPRAEPAIVSEAAIDQPEKRTLRLGCNCGQGLMAEHLVQGIIQYLHQHLVNAGRSMGHLCRPGEALQHALQHCQATVMQDD